MNSDIMNNNALLHTPLHIIRTLLVSQVVWATLEFMAAEVSKL